MWKAYLRLDTKILNLTQASYLWLLDRTGIYVGTLGFFCYVAGVASALARGGGFGPWFWFAVLIFVGLHMGSKYQDQDKGKNDKFNFLAITMAAWRGRHPFNIIFYSLLTSTVIMLDVLSFIQITLFIIYGYLQTVMIRDRDKKPFFENVHERVMEEGI